MDAGFIKYTINFHSAKFMSFNVYQESSSPYQRPRHAQAKTEINLNIIRKKALETCVLEQKYLSIDRLLGATRELALILNM